MSRPAEEKLLRITFCCAAGSGGETVTPMTRKDFIRAGYSRLFRLEWRCHWPALIQAARAWVTKVRSAIHPRQASPAMQ
jgi:hypothetical protein